VTLLEKHKMHRDIDFFSKNNPYILRSIFISIALFSYSCYLCPFRL